MEKYDVNFILGTRNEKLQRKFDTIKSSKYFEWEFLQGCDESHFGNEDEVKPSG